MSKKREIFTSFYIIITLNTITIFINAMQQSDHERVNDAIQ